MSLAGVILAAGRSARMGTAKALLDFRGAPFVVRILEALAALEVRPRLVVVGPDDAAIRAAVRAHDCSCVTNPDPDAGPIASLRVALRTLGPFRPAGVIAWPVDLPHVRVATIERLIDRHRRERPAAVVPAFAERRGHPVIWDAGLFAELLTSEAATAAGARAVLRAHRDAVAVIPVDDPAVIASVNTPEDYERLVREWNRDAY
jgi:molybdenum cofactor cytidylyltransferase